MRYCLHPSHTLDGTVAWFETDTERDCCEKHAPPPPPQQKPRVRWVDGKLVPV